jgi:hypothetical protein
MCEANGLQGEGYRVLFRGLTGFKKCTEACVNREIQRSLRDKERSQRILQAKDVETDSDDSGSSSGGGGGGGGIVHEKERTEKADSRHKIPAPSAEILSSIGIPIPNNTQNLVTTFDRILMNGVFVTFVENKGIFTDNQFADILIILTVFSDVQTIGKEPGKRYFKASNTVKVLPECYYYNCWDLVVSGGHSKKPAIYARRIYKDESENYLFLWAILSNQCFKVTQQCLVQLLQVPNSG